MIQKNENDIIVYDIDDTLINRFDKSKNDIIATYHYAKTQGYNIAIITARPGSIENLNATINQLAFFNITDYKYLFLRPPQMLNQVDYKLSARKYLHDIGYRVVLSIGDMPWDIGMYGGVGIIV